MAKAKPTEGISKSDIVRKFVAMRPNVTASEVVRGVKSEHGVDVSLALASKVKSSPSRQAPRKPGRGKVHGRRAAAQATNGVSKADMIREAAKTLPKPVRPRDVMAVLAERGMTVSNAQVGQVLKGMGMRRRRGRRKAATASGATAGSAVATATASGLTIESLIAAKKLANQLGGVAVAKQAVDALARLG